jgi:hypothetical protein
VLIESIPGGAQIVDVESGESLGTTPEAVPVDSRRTRRVEIRLDGYTPQMLELRPGDRVSVVLNRPVA